MTNDEARRIIERGLSIPVSESDAAWILSVIEEILRNEGNDAFELKEIIAKQEHTIVVLRKRYAALMDFCVKSLNTFVDMEREYRKLGVVKIDNSLITVDDLLAQQEQP